MADRLERTLLPDRLFDPALGDLPFANVLVADRRYRNLSPLLHDDMSLRTVDRPWPGGIAILITSRGFLDKETTGLREAVRDRATLVAARRRRRSIGTRARVVAAVLVLQRRPELLTAVEVRHRSAIVAGDIDWLSTEALAGTPGAVSVNRYLAERPEHTPGTASVVSGPYGPTLSGSGERDDAVLADAIARLLRGRVALRRSNALRCPIGASRVILPVGMARCIGLRSPLLDSAHACSGFRPAITGGTQLQAHDRC